MKKQAIVINLIIVVLVILGGLVYWSLNKNHTFYGNENINGDENVNIDNINDNQQNVLINKVHNLFTDSAKKYEQNYTIDKINITIDNNNFVTGTVNWEGKEIQSLWFATKVDNDWIIPILSTYNYTGTCQEFAKYNFPMDMIPDCWDTDKNVLVDAINPDQFYNGLTKKDKEEIEIAWRKYIDNEYFDELELYVRFNKNNNKYVSGTMLIGGSENHSAAYFLAVKDHNKWIVVYNGQEDPKCEVVDIYNFPLDIVSMCWDKNNNRITR